MTREIKKLDKNIFELKCSAFKGRVYSLEAEKKLGTHCRRYNS